jgi:hypothetical protein
MRWWLALAGLALSWANSASAETAGACVWRMTPESDRQAYLQAYRSGPRASAAVLSKMDGALHKSFATCVGRSDVPLPWARGAIASYAIQQGAAEAAAGYGISRDQLEAAWREAPRETLVCYREAGGKPFGVKEQSCPDPKVTFWFAEKFGVPPNKDLRGAAHLGIYYIAKAQGMWAQALIDRFLAEPSKPR